MRALLAIFLFLSAITIVSGALGLTTLYECETKTDDAGNLIYYTDSLKIKCYHSSAMTSAYIGDIEQAKTICESIFLEFGSNDPNDPNDLTKVAGTAVNACYYDVAKIARDPAICEKIERRYDFQSQLLGDKVTQDNCFNEVCRLAQLVPQNYYGNAPQPVLSNINCPQTNTTNENVCNMIFILPLLFLGVWKYNR